MAIYIYGVPAKKRWYQRRSVVVWTIIFGLDLILFGLLLVVALVPSALNTILDAIYGGFPSR